MQHSKTCIAKLAPRTHKISALSPAEVTGMDPATLVQLGSSVCSWLGRLRFVVLDLRNQGLCVTSTRTHKGAKIKNQNPSTFLKVSVMSCCGIRMRNRGVKS